MDAKGKRRAHSPCRSRPWWEAFPGLARYPAGPPAWRKLLNQCEQIFHPTWDSVPTALPVGS
jgi:hypothetical protein